MVFELNKSQIEKINKWEKELIPKILQIFQKKPDEYSHELEEYNKYKFIYYGAIGGGITYQFTPTSLGICCKVIESYTKEELDLTDYDEW